MNVLLKNISLSLAAASLLSMSACKNGDNEFDDFDYTAAFFSFQSPIRTLVMGKDFENNTDLDNEHRCRIGAAIGGSYSGKNATLGISVDNSLCNNLYFDEDGNNPVKPMPESYYELGGNSIVFDNSLSGFVDVHLTDAFFADPLSAQTTYVIPVVINSFSGVDKVLEGSYDTESYSSAPSLTNSDAWKVLPKNFTLYCVKYKSKYHGCYLRRGTDNINGVEVKREFKNEYKIEDDVIETFQTLALNKVSMTVDYLIDNVKTPYTIVMTFDDNQNCTITSETEGVTISGSGQYVDGGAGKYWGDRDRDQLTLNYTINDGVNNITTSDILVMQRRDSKIEEFKYYYKTSK